MEINIPLLTSLQQQASDTAYTTFLNCYLREYRNWHRFYAIPKYDETLAAHFRKVNHDRWIKIEMKEAGTEVYCAVKNYSETGRHSFSFPVVARSAAEDVLREISLTGFMDLVIRNHAGDHGPLDREIMYERINNSRENTELFLQRYLLSPQSFKVNDLVLSFIQAEQSMLLGHTFHPLAKGRKGFDREELISYSPETRGSFQLHYFFAHPSIVVEQSAMGENATGHIRAQLLSDPLAGEVIRKLVSEFPEWKFIPAHPWEASYLLQQEDVDTLTQAGLLRHLGALGKYYQPTSSVRTVYNEEDPFMYKLSLHVKITNSERVNLPRELHRGYDISRLMKTAWGEQIRHEFPDLEFITDPCFIMIRNGEHVIEGFNTSIRNNPFHGEGRHRNVTPLAALCQEGIAGHTSRLHRLIGQFAAVSNSSTRSAAERWFEKYIELLLKPLIKIYNQYGLACEAHQQNILLELDENGFPAKICFRDNQGFFFREGKRDFLHSFLPDLASESASIVPEEMIHPKYTYYLMANNVFGVIHALSSFTEEEKLMRTTYKFLSRLREEDEAGLAAYILDSRDWQVKANLITSMLNMDEARAPIENPAVYVDYPNPLSKYFFCRSLIKPGKNVNAFHKYFSEQDLEISIRPFDLERDLEMVHEWFNQEHTKAFWSMDGPIKNLEAFYIMLMESDHSHAHIGEINGEPTFTMEPYWPMRDTVGKYYNALASDYGAHLLIAPTDKNKKFSIPIIRTVMEFIFSHSEVGKCIGEANVNAKAMHILVTRVGFKLQGVIEMPHKKANLTFCTRESYRERFPENELAEQKQTL